MAHHAVVGSHRTGLDVPGPAHDLLGLGQAEGRVVLVEGLAQQCRLVDRGQVGQKDPAGPQRLSCGLDHFVGLRHVEQDPVEVGFVDALGHVADLDAVGRIGPQRGGDVGLGPLGEVLAQLVPHHGGAGPQHRHRQGARTDPGLEDALARSDVGRDQDGAEILRVDHLGPARHLEHDVAQRGPQHQEGTPGRTIDGAALVDADDVVVGQYARMGMEGGPGDQRQEVAAVLGIDEEDTLPCRQGSRHRVGFQASAGAGALASRTEMRICSPGASVTEDTLLVRSLSTRRRMKVEPASRNQYQFPATPRRIPARTKRRRRMSTLRAAGSRRRQTWSVRAGVRPGRPGR